MLRVSVEISHLTKYDAFRRNRNLVMDLEICLDVNFCKDHRNKIEVPDPLAVEDLISSKLNNKRRLARLITQYGDIFFSNISEGTAFLLQVPSEILEKIYPYTV